MTNYNIKKYHFGSMLAIYITFNEVTSFVIVPEGTEENIDLFKMSGENPYGYIQPEPCMQIALEGDCYSRDFSAGKTHKNTSTSYNLKLYSQVETFEKDYHYLVSTFKTKEGIIAKQNLRKHNDYETIECFTEVINESDKPITLEMVAAFTINRLSPFNRIDNPNEIILHRMQSYWSAEGKLVSESAANLSLENSWSGLGIREQKFGQIGSMPARDYLPFVAIEDKKNSTIWAVQIEAPTSWQIEVTHRNNGIHLSGGIADFTSGHWKKTLNKGDSFSTNKAFLTVVKGELLDATDNIIQYFNTRLNTPKSEKDLPVIYNEYCYSWGKPNLQKIKPLVPACKDFNIGYFVMDAGWYRTESQDWNSLGDWNCNKIIFPNGLKEYSNLVNSHKMKAGIWYEFESVSSNSVVAVTHPEYLLTYCGKIINHGERSFLDFRKKEVIAYVEDKVTRQLKENNIEYLKVDYNENIGVGVDGAESFGEGLRQHINAVLDFFDSLRKELPSLVIEICSSGGMRHEPLFISKGSMVSFSDAHECPSGAVIASNLHRFMLPSQMQIWATIKEDFDEQDTYFTISKALLGRYCLSGNIENKSEAIKNIIKESIEFYEILKPIIKNGKTILIEDSEIESYYNTKGGHYLLRESNDKSNIAVYVFSIDLLGKIFEIPLCDSYKISAIFNSTAKAEINKNSLLVVAPKARQWGAVILLKKDK